MDMLVKFPCMVPQNPQCTEYDGYIEILDQEYRLNIVLPPNRKIHGAKIACEWKLDQVLKKYDKIIKQRLAQCETLVSFLEELKKIAEKQLGYRKQQNIDRSSQSCSRLISELEAVGWEKVVFVDADFQKFHLKYTDIRQREHIIKIQLLNQHPKHCPNIIVDLPNKFDVVWTHGCSLLDIYKQFTQTVNSYQDFWDCLAELDQKTWILEPDNPTYSATSRRIALSTNASLQVVVNPKHPHSLPECRFMGASQVINPLRENMTSNLHLWNEEFSLMQNLSMVLGITFPSPTNTKKEEFSVECGICYSYRLDGEIPEEVCNDTRCGQPFHQSCLSEWLRALPSCRQSFNTIFGECPYCEKPITVKMTMKS